MTFLSALLGLLAVATMAALLLLTVRRDRDIRRNAPGAVVRGTPLEGRGGGRSTPPAVR